MINQAVRSLDLVPSTVQHIHPMRPAREFLFYIHVKHIQLHCRSGSGIGGRPTTPELDDMMVITEVPDILHSGKVHNIDVQNYRGTHR
jgi:DNA polymerase II small subunit